jgi:hypothetical protein
LSRKTKKTTIGASARSTRRQAAKKRHAAERQRAQEIGFLALAKEVAQENAETLRLLAKH